MLIGVGGGVSRRMVSGSFPGSALPTVANADARCPSGQFALYRVGRGVQHVFHPRLSVARPLFLPVAAVAIDVLAHVEAQGAGYQSPTDAPAGAAADSPSIARGYQPERAGIVPFGARFALLYRFVNRDIDALAAMQANLATGVINMSMATMYASDATAMIVLTLYALGVCGAAWATRDRRLLKL